MPAFRRMGASRGLNGHLLGDRGRLKEGRPSNGEVAGADEAHRRRLEQVEREVGDKRAPVGDLKGAQK
eukprot:8709108-Alexandrium_andersonii.AAC.1